MQSNFDCMVMETNSNKFPRGYLSYSSLLLWEKSPAQFRDRYYLNKPAVDTPYTLFGKESHELISTMSHIPHYSVMESEICITLQGVPLKGYIDSFDPPTGAFIEYKTGINKSDGTDRWTQSTVNKWKQLPFYAMCIKEKMDMFVPKTTLVFLESAWDVKKKKVGSCELIFSKKLILTGRHVIFERTLTLEELEETKRWVLRLAIEIEEDYKKCR